jgi:hypothetical protein
MRDTKSYQGIFKIKIVVLCSVAQCVTDLALRLSHVALACEIPRFAPNIS